MTFTLLTDPPAAGAWNMAVDEVLLESAAQADAGTWRFYGWTEPTLSLGFFQADDDRQSHAASKPCAAVRRLTGGGAILHDVELTYSLAVPGRHPLARHRDALYETVHGSLIETLATLGVHAALYGCGQPERTSPFLCFQRRNVGDVLLDGWKIAGSAQRRRRGAVLQHGSVLLRTSTAAPELPGIAELSGKSLTAAALRQRWLSGLAKRLGLDWCRGELTAPQHEKAAVLATERYAADAWTHRRG